MRGSPLLNALIAFLAIALLGIPVQRLTSASAVPLSPPAPEKVTPHAKVPVELRFTTPPKSVRIQHLGKSVWSIDDPGTSADAEFTLPWPKEGVDLLFEIAWPDDSPLSAARVTITDPESREHVESIWGRGRTNKVLTFQ
jgi:hypothetical protein